MLKITKPTLLLNKKTAIRNINNMANKAKASKVNYRPHFKTHFSREIGAWYKDAGVTSITVSSIDMAVYFAGQGWKDIIIAFPINILQLDVLNHLSKQIRLGLVVESADTTVLINQSIAHSVDVYIKVDTGYGRTGIWHENLPEIKKVYETVAAPHVAKGLLAHFGHTYKASSKEKILEIYHSGVAALSQIKSALDSSLMISVGDTPSCSLVDSFDQIDEIRPGNLVFYDVMQTMIGSCSYEDIAVCLAVPVVAIHADRGEIVVHGGAVHLSKESLHDEKGSSYYGTVVKLEEKGWTKPLESMSVISLSQEHGIVKVPLDQLSQFNVGDLLGILPVHSCLTANLMKEYVSLRGEKITTLHQ